VGTPTNRRVAITVAGVVVVTEAASTRRKRAAERRRPRVPGRALLAELALHNTQPFIAFERRQTKQTYRKIMRPQNTQNHITRNDLVQV